MQGRSRRGPHRTGYRAAVSRADRGGLPLYRSALLAEIVAVPGVREVDGLIWQGAAFADYGESPGNGAWFDVTLTVNATEAQDG